MRRALMVQRTLTHNEQYASIPRRILVGAGSENWQINKRTGKA